MNIESLLIEFKKVFNGNTKGVRFFSAPGRVNLIGEHIDYCGGYVFPAALTLGNAVAVRYNDSKRVNVSVTDIDGVFSFDLDDIDKARILRYGNYQAGVLDEMIKAGYNVPGMDMLFYSDLPHGSGLSSSASIELATGIAALSALKYDIKEEDLIGLALIGQKAEHNFCGINCGIMDQFASAMGKMDNAIMLNCSSLEYEYVPTSLGDYCLVLANTCKKHALGASKYNERRKEVDTALDILNKASDLKRTVLCDYTTDDFEMYKSAITDETIKKRAEHVINENARVKEAVAILRSGDLNAFGDILRRANDSIRYLYEVTGYELDTMYDIAVKEDGVIGSRMTGAGFGGCIINIVHKNNTRTFMENVGRQYKKSTGITPEFYVCDIGDGARELKV